MYDPRDDESCKSETAGRMPAPPLIPPETGAQPGRYRTPDVGMTARRAPKRDATVTYLKKQKHVQPLPSVTKISGCGLFLAHY